MHAAQDGAAAALRSWEAGRMHVIIHACGRRQAQNKLRVWPQRAVPTLLSSIVLDHWLFTRVDPTKRGQGCTRVALFNHEEVQSDPMYCRPGHGRSRSKFLARVVAVNTWHVNTWIGRSVQKKRNVNVLASQEKEVELN